MKQTTCDGLDEYRKLSNENILKMKEKEKEEYINLLLFNVKTDKERPNELLQRINKEKAKEFKKRLMKNLDDESDTDSYHSKQSENDQLEYEKRLEKNSDLHSVFSSKSLFKTVNERNCNDKLKIFHANQTSSFHQMKESQKSEKKAIKKADKKVSKFSDSLHHSKTIQSSTHRDPFFEMDEEEKINNWKEVEQTVSRESSKQSSEESSLKKVGEDTFNLNFSENKEMFGSVQTRREQRAKEKGEDLSNNEPKPLKDC